MVRDQWHAFFNSWVFFTRLPAPKGVRFDDRYLNLGSRYFSWVGVLLGVMLAAVYSLAAIGWPPAVATAVTLGIGLLLTGAFHEDGLADLFDGFGGGFTRDRVLTIMKDSRLGTYGAAALFITVVLRWQVLTDLLNRDISAWLLLPFIHGWSRFWAISTLWTLPYADSQQASKSKPLAQAFGPAASLVALVPLLGLMPFLPLEILATATLVALCLRTLLVRWFQHRIQGYTGDCLGGAQQLQEVAVLLVWLALA